MDNITPETLAYAFLSFKLDNARPKKIKVTSEFADYLEKIPQPTYVDASSVEGVQSAFIGIPVEIDDTIENEYYELVY